MTFQFWQRWLVVVGVLIVTFGIVLTLLNQTALFNVIFNSRVEAAFWPTGGATSQDKAFQQWIYGVLGATVTGWGIVLTFIAAHPFTRREPWAWHCLAASIGTWFVIDTAISFAFGVAINVLFNTVLLIAAGLPLLGTWSHFSGRSSDGQ